MNNFEYWDPYFADNKYPCYVRDKASEEIIYANQEFYRAFDCDETILGKKFYEVVDLDDHSYDHIKSSISGDTDYNFGFYHKRTHQHCRGFAHMIRDNLSVFCQFRIILNQDSDLEKALSRCMDLYKLPSEQALLGLTELLREFYQSKRAFVHSFDRDKQIIHCIAQDCPDPLFRVGTEVLSGDDAIELMEWIEFEQENGFLSIDLEKSCLINDKITVILEYLKVSNLALCAVRDVNKNVVGLVGFSNSCLDVTNVDNRLLITVARFVAQDVTKGMVEKQLLQLHYRDALTGLYNRVGYAKKVDQILNDTPQSMGVISANVNGLKFINEHSGIESGDEHIKISTRKLTEHFGYEFFRMSGDEFLGLAPNVDKDAFEEKAKELFHIMEHEDNFDFSFGHAWAKGKINLDKVIFEAETVMYINKQEYYANSERKFDVISDNSLSALLRFLDNDEFMIYLQPQVHLHDGSLYGAEALIRRFDKTNQKMVFPDQFIADYEQKSIIRHVDIFVVEAVCALLAQWQTKGKGIPISVNLSRVTLQEYGIVDNIVRICDKYKVPHSLLVIEVTERVGLIENNVASALINDFKNHGFHISLDDFGCAYSNIITLAQIEVDEVKIDKSLVDHITTSHKNHVLVKNVLSMCHDLENTSSLAEGIEDEAQAELLHSLGCHLGQGYFYSRPIPVDEFQKKYIDD